MRRKRRQAETKRTKRKKTKCIRASVERIDKEGSVREFSKVHTRKC